MIALADCNNLYASCEAVFRPSLAEQPVIVLGNNDGCVIARNARAKRLGITMGAPAHTLRALIQRHEVVVCSANFALSAESAFRSSGVMRLYAPLCAYATRTAQIRRNSHDHERRP